MNRIYIETYGCANNMAESQIMAGILTRNNFEIINNIELSDVVILNTCSVKNATINKIICRMREIQKKYPGKKLIISGCMPETEYDLIIRTAPDASIVSTNHITKITKAVTEKSRVEFIGSNKEIKVCLPKIRNNRVIDIVPVCSGCASFCSFCSTKLAKGNVFSYPEDKIIGEISDAKKFGAKEFWITGQDVSAYGLDTNEISLLPELINKITERVGGKYFLRIGMLNPRHVIPILNKLIKSYKSDNVFKFLHLPVQTGSDAKKFGAKEFWITGQDVSAYGLDTNEISLLPELINKITERVGGKYFLRIGMLNPRHVIPILNKFTKSGLVISTIFTDSSKSFSVSSGNPVMMSVHTVISGINLLNLSTISTKSSALYPLFIFFSILSEPVCTGRCKNLNTLSDL